jgi:hypothetical protein
MLRAGELHHIVTHRNPLECVAPVLHNATGNGLRGDGTKMWRGPCLREFILLPRPTGPGHVGQKSTTSSLSVMRSRGIGLG